METSLGDRITVPNAADLTDPEDIFSSGLASIFPGQELNLHGDPGQTLVYRSPHCRAPLRLRLADPTREADRTLFSHYVWNASLLLAELVEAETLDVALRPPRRLYPDVNFGVQGRSVVELGAGAGLVSIMAGLVGAERVVATDFPSETVLAPLRENVTSAGVRAEVVGHAWGDEMEGGLGAHAFDRVVATDVLWMPWEHGNLCRSVDRLLARGPAARAWIVAAMHTGRDKVARFLEAEALAKFGLVVEGVWERDSYGAEREWEEVREEDDAVYRKRWLVVIVLKRI